MAITSIAVLILLVLAFSIQEMANDRYRREATLNANAVAIAKTLDSGGNPALLHLYRDYPQDYGFRVFDHRLPVKRHVLASANTGWLPAVQSSMPDADDQGDARDSTAVNTKLIEDFSLIHGPLSHDHPTPTIAALTRRVALACLIHRGG